jgi:16S rRNA U1498 N3-methylase RsmE
VRPVPMGLVPLAHVIETTAPGQGIILDPRAGDSLAQVLGGRDRGAPITLLVGGDTGFTDAEADTAVAAGFSAAQMGVGVLRAETAAIAAATLALNHLGGLS